MKMSEKLTPAQAQILATFFKNYVFPKIVEPLDLELSARGAVLWTLKQTHPDLAPIIDALLDKARADPALRESMHQKYHVALEKPVQQFLEHVQDVESLERMIRDLKLTDLN